MTTYEITTKAPITSALDELLTEPSITTVVLGPPGAKGDQGPSGALPVGGTTGQVLVKQSSTDGDADWEDDPGSVGSSVPPGGTTGQVLTKLSNTDGDADWADDVDTDAVTSVNTQTGDVVLDYNDVGADQAGAAAAGDAVEAAARIAADSAEATARANADALLQPLSAKNQANGYAPLDGSALVPDANIPSGIARDSEVTAAVAAEATARDAAIAVAVAALVNGAPGILDTLEEIADALGDDPNFAATVTTALAGKQPLDAELTALAALVSAANKMPYFTGSGAAALADLTSYARTLLDDADAPTARTTLGLGSAATSATTDFDAAGAAAAAVTTAESYADGKVLDSIADADTTHAPSRNAVFDALALKQDLDATLTALAALATAADKLIYATGSDAFATTTLSSFIRTLLDDADAATARGTLGLDTAATHPATDFQAADAELSALAGLTSAANTVPVFTGSGTAALVTLAASQFLGRKASGNVTNMTVAEVKTLLALALSDLSDASTVALLASPTFTGDPKAPTPAAGDNDTSIATTAFVTNAVAKQAEVLIIAVSDESTAITTGAAKVKFRMPFAMTLTKVRASLSTASTSGNPAVNVKESGTTIFSTTLTIDANELTSETAATAAVLSDTSLADDAEIQIDIDTAGTGAKGLKVTFIGTRT